MAHIVHDYVHKGNWGNLTEKEILTNEKDRECDFIVEKEDGSFSAVQVCHELTDDNKNREFDGLTAALKRFGLKSGIIVTHAQSDLAIQDGYEISIMPVTEYLVDPKISR